MKYKKEYEAIVEQFKMPDRPEDEFDPKNENFIELISYALRKAFADFNFRTLKLTKNEDGKNKIEVLKCDKSVTDYLIEKLKEKDFQKRFIDYFEAAPLCKDDFDDWHHKTCEAFLNIIKGLNIYEGIQYGKAQKIVNMIFKHLYCLDGADSYAEYFKHCHMVLDNFTLEWFKRNVSNTRIDSWSNLVYKKPFVNKNDYMFYQVGIRDYFEVEDKNKNPYTGLTPFQAEFYIWPGIQLHLAAEALYFLAMDDEAACKIIKDEKLEVENIKDKKRKAREIFKKKELSEKMPFLKTIVDAYIANNCAKEDTNELT